jgi:hypothetical protein
VKNRFCSGLSPEYRGKAALSKIECQGETVKEKEKIFAYLDLMEARGGNRFLEKGKARRNFSPR